MAFDVTAEIDTVINPEVTALDKPVSSSDEKKIKFMDSLALPAGAVIRDALVSNAGESELTVTVAVPSRISRLSIEVGAKEKKAVVWGSTK